MRHARNEAERFWEKVDKSGDCWLWRGTIQRGYGLFSARTTAGGNTTIGAHRWSYIAAGGTIPPGHQIHHICNTPSCVNPAHLRAVTPHENAAAIVERTRRAPIKYGKYDPTRGPATTIAFVCRDSINQQIRAYAADHQLSLSYVINIAIDQFLSRAQEDRDDDAA